MRLQLLHPLQQLLQLIPIKPTQPKTDKQVVVPAAVAMDAAVLRDPVGAASRPLLRRAEAALPIVVVFRI
jgi:hypothetical protein